jgi:hypothetical protein
VKGNDSLFELNPCLSLTVGRKVKALDVNDTPRASEFVTESTERQGLSLSGASDTHVVAVT